ncbi:MAG: FtsW/RodA/SpoVE family cell cycle protein [Lachnospiraceae bacterium]|nr:FtsW/RodA/SpoVE family cell cycle protein [Lachnospiraceae bacterium]
MGSGGKYTGDGFDDISPGYKKERVYSLGDAYDRKKKNPSTTSKSIEEEEIAEKPGKNKRLKRSAARREAEERNERKEKKIVRPLEKVMRPAPEKKVDAAASGKKRSYYDFSIIVIILFLLVAGLFSLYSVSYYSSAKYYGDAMFYVKRQAIFAVIGFVLMIVVSFIPYHFYTASIKIGKFGTRPVFLFYLMCIVLEMAILLMGIAAGGSKRWIQLGPIKFEPAEINKVAVILMTALLIGKSARDAGKIFEFFRVLVFVMAALILPIAKQNLSSGIIMFAIAFVICFVGSDKKRWWIVLLIIGALAAIILVKGEGYRGDRFIKWSEVETNPDSYQVREGLYAIASGGMFGKSFGQGTVKLGYLVEGHTDEIFASICEEIGVFGIACLLLVYLLLIWRIKVIADNAPDAEGGLICVGVMVQIAVQVALNICVATSVIPPTGVTLPFFSYGGTALVILLVEIGLVLSVSMRITE